MTRESRASGTPARPAITDGTLFDLANEGAVFGIGAFFTHGRLDVDPVAEYFAHRPEIRTAYVGRFQLLTPPFAGVDARGPWDHAVDVCERAHWPGLLRFLSGIVGRDPRDGFYWRAQPQALVIRDVDSATRRHVGVTGFGIDSTAGTFAFRAIGGGATLQRYPASRQTLRIGRTLSAPAAGPEPLLGI